MSPTTSQPWAQAGYPRNTPPGQRNRKDMQAVSGFISLPLKRISLKEQIPLHFLHTLQPKEKPVAIVLYHEVRQKQINKTTTTKTDEYAAPVHCCGARGRHLGNRGKKGRYLAFRNKASKKRKERNKTLSGIQSARTSTGAVC